MRTDYRKRLKQIATTRVTPALFDHPQFNEICEALIGGEGINAVAKRFDVHKSAIQRLKQNYLSKRIKRAQREAKVTLASKAIDNIERLVERGWQEADRALEHAAEMGEPKLDADGNPIPPTVTETIAAGAALNRHDDLISGPLKSAIEMLAKAAGVFNKDNANGDPDTPKSPLGGLTINIGKVIQAPHDGPVFEFEDPDMEIEYRRSGQIKSAGSGRLTSGD